MDSVGDQCLGVADGAEKQLETRKHEVDGGTDQCHTPFDSILVLEWRVHAANALCIALS